MPRRAWILCLLMVAAAFLCADAQEEPTTEEPAKGKKKETTEGAGPDERGFIQLGSVRFNKKEKILEADGFFNMRAGYLEFLACKPGVKSHETLIALEVKPVDLNLGFILMGLTEAKDPHSNEDCRLLEGDRVVCWLRWQTKNDEGKVTVHEKRLEDCVFNAIVEESMERCGLVYTGAMDIDTNPAPLHLTEEEVKEWEKKNKPKMVFAPMVTGYFFSLVHEPLCILNNPLELPYSQGDYYANPDVLPPIDRENPVQVTMIFRRPKQGEIDYSIRRMKVPPPDEGSSEEENE